ncbi:hypothetical protein [Flavobacterium sp. W22_SRS_FP1]|uniref:hypothetical protein n=1 Tax=Flavobacterium sp. W22_SRS_FP1 TaxID=3240276 RepID=UPI003F932B04
MKKIKLIFALLALIVLIPSCSNDGGDSKREFENGGIPNLVKITTTDDFINLIALNNGGTFDLGLNVSIGQGEVSSMDIVAFYRKGDLVSKATFDTNITTFPATVNLSKGDIIAAFSELNSDSDFALGDQLTVSAELTLKDGSVIKILNDDGTTNYGQDIANSTVYAVVQNYNVSCPSDLGGTYSVLSSGTSTDSAPRPEDNPITDYPYTTVITDNGGGSYTMSDAFGGLEILWYSSYGLTFEVKGSFNDVCGDLSGTFIGAFTEGNVLTGTVNPDGTLTIRWDNDFGDFGDAIYTKN